MDKDETKTGSPSPTPSATKLTTALATGAKLSLTSLAPPTTAEANQMADGAKTKVGRSSSKTSLAMKMDEALEKQRQSSISAAADLGSRLQSKSVCLHLF